MFAVEIAGHTFIIENIYPHIWKICQKYRTESDTGIHIPITQEDIRREQTGDYPPGYLETIAVQRKVADYLITQDTLLFHGSAVAVDGKAYLFSAPSGTGKSTHTALWHKHFGSRAVMINDDKPFIKVTDDSAIIYGSPWSGKHLLDTNCSVPLKAVCMLERSDINHVAPLPDRDIFPALLQHAYRPSSPEMSVKVMDLVEKLSKTVKTYSLECNMEPDSVQVAYNGMNKP